MESGPGRFSLASRDPWLRYDVLYLSDSWYTLEGLQSWSCVSGKTVLSSTVVDDFAREGINNTTAYFYFDFRNRSKQYADKMLRSLIVQLASKHQFIPEPLAFRFLSGQDGTEPVRTEELELILVALIEASQKTVIVLDALDECCDRQELLHIIEKLMRWNSRKLNIIMTSRKEKEFEDFFDARLDDQSKLSIQKVKLEDDIRCYVHWRLHSDRRFKVWQRQGNVQEEIENKLVEESAGMWQSSPFLSHYLCWRII